MEQLKLQQRAEVLIGSSWTQHRAVSFFGLPESASLRGVFRGLWCIAGDGAHPTSWWVHTFLITGAPTVMGTEP